MTISPPPSPELTINPYADIDAELNAAYERNTGDAATVATGGLQALIEDRMKSTQPESLSTDFGASFNAAINETVDLFGTTNLRVPARDELLINSSRLSAAYELMQAIGQKPEVVIVPNDLSLGHWEEVYSNLPNVSEGGLYVNDDVKRLFSVPPQSLRVSWGVVVMPGDPKPPIVNVSHDQTKSDPAELQKLHQQEEALQQVVALYSIGYPTIAAYLTLQARNLKNGIPPIDAEIYTWLKETVNSGSGGVYGDWLPSNRLVRLDWNAVDDRYAYAGVRPAVRG